MFRCWLLLGTVLVWGCSMPRIIVLNDPLDARQHNDLGVAYEQRGDLDLASREYQRAAALDTGWALPLTNLGNLAARNSNWQEAASHYQEALARQPGNAETMNNLAWVLTKAGLPHQALSWAQQAVTASADDPRCWDTLAEVYKALGQVKDAHEAAARGLALDPTPELRTSLEAKFLKN